MVPFQTVVPDALMFVGIETTLLRIIAPTNGKALWYQVSPHGWNYVGDDRNDVMEVLYQEQVQAEAIRQATEEIDRMKEKLQ